MLQYLEIFVCFRVCISLALFWLGAYFNGLMDKSSEGKLSKDKNKGDTWKNKYKHINGDIVKYNKKPWYYFCLPSPVYVEKFPYSSTIFVSFTDYWHRMKKFMIECFKVAIVLISGLDLVRSLILYAALTLMFWIGFALSYKLKKW